MCKDHTRGQYREGMGEREEIRSQVAVNLERVYNKTGLRNGFS